MKAQRSLILLSMICLPFLFAGCGKEGSIKPQSNDNVGVVYSSNASPKASEGVNGDFYINTAAGLLFGPKTDSGWGSGVSLKGDAGNTTLSGSGQPAGTLGKSGDYYIDKTNALLYGPKTDSGWGVPVNLRGPQGPEGNANVKVDTFTVKTADWSATHFYEFATGNGAALTYPTKSYDRNNSLITASQLSSGVVLVYFQSAPETNAAQWQPLPFSFNDVYGGYAYNYAFETFVGKVRLHFYFTKITADPPAISTYNVPVHKFKIVVVAGTLLNSIRQNHIDVNNYKQVSGFLGIQ
jgi:hypothetical protein